jgi:AraC-like DNA-binding protein
MPAYSPTIPVRYTALVAACVQETYPDQAALFAAAGLDAALLELPDATMTLAELHLLLQQAERASGRHDLGFDIGRRVDFATHGVLGRALQGCATLDQAMRMGSRYGSLITPSFAVEYRRTGDIVELIYRPVAPMTPELMRFMFEAHIVSLHNNVLVALLQQRLQPYDIYFSIEAPAHARRYRELAPARVHFGASALPEVRMVMQAAQMDLPIATVHADRIMESESHCKTLLDNTRREQSWSEWVRLILHEAEHCQPTIEQLAQLLNMGPHTLSRHLQREQQNFRVLSSQVRHARACRLLSEGRTPITQIAYRLGYQGVAAFSEAFRRIAGQSPRAWRKAAPASIIAGIGSAPDRRPASSPRVPGTGVKTN